MELKYPEDFEEVVDAKELSDEGIQDLIDDAVKTASESGLGFAASGEILVIAHDETEGPLTVEVGKLYRRAFKAKKE